MSKEHLHASPFRVLTKGQLCEIFGLKSRSRTGQRYYYKKLRSDYFTDAALNELNIPLSRYKKVNGNFTFAETKRIIEYFKITPDETANL